MSDDGQNALVIEARGRVTNALERRCDPLLLEGTLALRLGRPGMSREEPSGLPGPREPAAQDAVDQSLARAGLVAVAVLRPF